MAAKNNGYTGFDYGVRDDVVRNRPAHLAISWRIRLGSAAELYVRGTGTRSRMQTRSFALITGDRLFVARFDEGYRGSEWSIDERHVRRGGSGAELIRDRAEQLAMVTYLRESGAIRSFSELAARYPFPPVLSLLARLGVAFSSELLRNVDHAARFGHYSAFRHFGSRSDDESSNGSCTDDIWCAPEFRTCGDCGETTEVFDPPDPPWGGGVTPGDPARCERTYRIRLRDCRIAKYACTPYDEPIDDVGRPIPPPEPREGPFASVPLEDTDLLRAASDFDRCFRQYEICVDQALWSFERCIATGAI